MQQNDEIRRTIFFLWDSDCGDWLWHWWLDRCGATEALGLSPFLEEDTFYKVHEVIENKVDVDGPQWECAQALEKFLYMAHDQIDSRGVSGEHIPGHEDYDEEIASWTHTSDDLRRWTIEVAVSEMDFRGKAFVELEERQAWRRNLRAACIDDFVETHA